MANPVVKWIGGKRQLVPELVKHLPEGWWPADGTYYEPFVGGGALFFDLKTKYPMLRAHLNDANPHLINLYTQVRDDVEGVLTVSRELAKDRSEEAYYALRSKFNSVGYYSSVGRAAAFIFINRGGFNGLWRVNKQGGCNVPYGGFRAGCQEGKAALVDEDNLRAVSEALQGVELTCGDYKDAVENAVAGDLVYFDPPYIPKTATANFTSYTADGFNDADQIDLCALAKTLTARGVHVLLSNSDTPRTREIYTAGLEPYFLLHEVQARRAVNSDATKRGAVGELIIEGITP